MTANPFFHAFKKHENFDPYKLFEQAKKELLPFIYYLKNSIKVLEQKEVTCYWEPLVKNLYRLKPDRRVWLFIPECEIKIDDSSKDWFEIFKVDGKIPDTTFDPDEREPVNQGKGKSSHKISLPRDGFKKYPFYQLHLPDFKPDDRPVYWNNYKLELKPMFIKLEDLTKVHIDGQSCSVIARNVNERRITLEGFVKENSRLEINGQNSAFELTKGFNPTEIEQFYPEPYKNGWLLFSSDKPKIKDHNISDLTSEVLPKLSIEHFHLKERALLTEDWSIKSEEKKNRELELIIESKSNKKLTNEDKLFCNKYPKITFSVDENKIEKKWIQLIEKNIGKDNGKSDLDYFCLDYKELKILDSTQKKSDKGFKIIESRPEERQILLAINDKQSRRSIYPTFHDKKEIKVKVNTKNLQRQKDAIENLMNRPSYENWPLIKLLQCRSEISWKYIESADESSINWQILTDLGFGGCDRQREFVAKALTNEDFTILDGPPGTGKTTTILELIFQLIKQGKRVLLSASTHAAINNVLERVKLDEELSKYIFPLRVGDEDKAIGIEEYQFDKLFEDLSGKEGCKKITKQLMVDSSNLVCGTTIGILRLFNEKDIAIDIGIPPFDVMIIDECSKTTFQEFLVPARYAKRWVLVGDIRQLSPFSDREQIVSNLDELMLKPPLKKHSAEFLSPEIQQACYLLERLRSPWQNNPYQYSCPILLPVSKLLAEALDREISARKLGDEICVICREESENFRKIISLKKIIENPWKLYEKNLYFVDDRCLNELLCFAPDNMIILHRDWARSAHAARFNFIGNHLNQEFDINIKKLNKSSDIHTNLIRHIEDSKWSEEICWRLDREYWLRQVSNPKRRKNLTSALSRLYPKSINSENSINKIRDISFPSILEALSLSGLEKNKNQKPTTLNQGFSPEEKEIRHTTLSHQHRMHPEISEYPRTQFYPEDVLKDGNRIDRYWEYNRYKSRSAWVNVHGETEINNKNKKEGNVLINELEAFCNWAENIKNTNGNSHDVAILTFYKGQEGLLREKLRELTNNKNKSSRFLYKGINIKLATVDYIQGQEADVVFLSMVNTARDGFMDTPNRINVAITRARYQLVIVGYHHYFSKISNSVELKGLAESCSIYDIK